MKRYLRMLVPKLAIWYLNKWRRAMGWGKA